MNEPSKRGMSVGGVDPSILRELSGVYKPFIKAFKELVSNAYDADATEVSIEFADDFTSATISDDGIGMSPFEFRCDFTRIGGSSRKWSMERTPKKKRRRIGNKGIGFLALARYCHRMIVTSSSPRQFDLSHSVEETSPSIDIVNILGVPIDPQLLRKVCRFKVTQSGKRQEIDATSYELNANTGRLVFKENIGQVDIAITIDCSNLGFHATLDFDRLLKLADSADLEKLSDFVLIEVRELQQKTSGGTTVAIEGLKSFVKHELRAGRRKGFVRNVASRSGFEQVEWHLSRCTPIGYATAPVQAEPLEVFLDDASPPTLGRLTLRHVNSESELTRPLYPFEPDAATLHNDMITKVDINEGGLLAKGFVLGYENVVFPAEYRGVSIRVRGVAIGDPTFLGAEFLLTGAHKAALSQITGEINVLRGLDAVDAINPGREGFYEESRDFLTLRRYFRGDGEKVVGYLGRTIDAVLKRSQARSSLNSTLSRAAYIRRAMDDVSAGITHLMTEGGKRARAIRDMFKSNKSHPNGLASAKPAGFGVPNKVAGMAVNQARRQSEAASIDYEKREVMIDVSRPEWDNGLVLFKRRFDVIHRLGTAIQPIAEIDFQQDRILINWGHAAKSQMDERGFLRTALAWVLARTAADGDADQMMDIAITLLSFTTQPND
ncbi:MAG: ATP-binding protein [Gemmatimonadota bacterium]|nr:ATP-binding protein [Gemmatimonadota bacterium]